MAGSNRGPKGSNVSSQNKPQSQDRKQITITVIGDVVFDNIVIDEGKGEQSKEYPGGALFVKTFLESDPAIGSVASIYGYIYPLELNTNLGSTIYDLNLVRKVNTIPLEKQGTGNFNSRSYRIKTPSTKTEPEDQEVVIALQRIDARDKPELSMLVVTDLGISSTATRHSDGQSNFKSFSAGIGERLFTQANSQQEVETKLEWKWHLDAAYDANQAFAKSSMPWHFITISNPTEALFQQSVYSLFKNSSSDPLGKRLYEDHSESEKISQIRNKTLAIVYGDHLRSGCNMAIARRISIERTAQDFLQELYTNPLLVELGRFEHLVVRFGLLSVVHSYRIKNRRFHRLFFDPGHIYDPMYSTKLSGVVTGNQTVLLDNIIRQLLALTPAERYNPYDVTERIGVGIKLGIQDCKERYDHGYGADLQEALNFLNPRGSQPAFVPEAFTGKRRRVKEIAIEEELVKHIADERIPIAHPAWSILAQSAEYKLLEAAENIVYHGVDGAFKQNKPGWSPIARFGKMKEMIVLERYELERYRSVQLLMEEAMNPENKSILSIAVFGPPGSGKSFVSERIANSACDASQVSAVIKKINLASIHDANQLTGKINHILKGYFPGVPNDDETEDDENEKKRKTHQNKQLIIFFDEFDCTVNEKSLGWLKTFLPMMQDGEFSDTYNTHKSSYLGHSQPILIFAGGTSHTYSSFSRQDFSGDPEDQLRFAQAKGPDFISRLRGHIDILGPSKTSELDEGYVIRRAILLRTAFFKRIKQTIPIRGDENLDRFLYKPLVRALLTVSKYKHGARSMEALVNMCGIFPGGRITASSMPPHAQLNMHVDANEFQKLVLSYR